MIYPGNFENKIGFDRIRRLLSEKCLSPMGLEKVDEIRFLDDFNAIDHQLSATWEFQQILTFEDFFPSENYFRISGMLVKIRIEGTFPEVQEVFDLRRSLETVKTILAFFKGKEAVKYPVLREMAGSVKSYPYVLDAADKIIDKRGVIKDNASSRLKEIR
ncbi:MAG TPA: endonuclease MutS2, partial [Bacteroidales bacterium]|nr:endonuclease MutS2 [Bacteroidales bacterium]